MSTSSAPTLPTRTMLPTGMRECLYKDCSTRHGLSGRNATVDFHSPRHQQATLLLHFATFSSPPVHVRFTCRRCTASLLLIFRQELLSASRFSDMVRHRVSTTIQKTDYRRGASRGVISEIFAFYLGVGAGAYCWGWDQKADAGKGNWKDGQTGGIDSREQKI